MNQFYNLINEKWLPVFLEKNKIQYISPWEVSKLSKSNGLAFPRRDFVSAGLEFLIGLYQTILPPEDVDGFEEYFDTPPDEIIVRQKMEEFKNFFYLYGDRPLFMQDFTLKKDNSKTHITSLLIEQPGVNTVKENKDFFVKRNQVKNICPSCAAISLYTLQVFAPSGGQGHRTSLRGGGPLSSIVFDKNNLWKTIASNLIPKNLIHEKYPTVIDDYKSKVFPWMSETKVSENNITFNPEEGHFLHNYWGMPRRLLLEPEKTENKNFTCDLCNLNSSVRFCEYITRPNGFNYSSTWKHPLSPYVVKGAEEEFFSIKGNSGATGYKHWLEYIYGNPALKSFVEPSRVVRNYRFFTREKGEIRLSGYDMDNMKARNWCESSMPIYSTRLSTEQIIEEVSDIVNAAQSVSESLVSSLKSCLVNKFKEKKGGLFFDSIQDFFWNETEKDFYFLTEEIHKKENISEESSVEIRKKWKKIITDKAISIFEIYAESGSMSPAKMKKIYKTKAEFIKKLNKSINSILGI